MIAVFSTLSHHTDLLLFTCEGIFGCGDFFGWLVFVWLVWGFFVFGFRFWGFFWVVGFICLVGSFVCLFLIGLFWGLLF